MSLDIQRPSRVLTLSILASLSGGVCPALAQQAESAGQSTSLEAIVVTAQKRSENSQDVPIAVAAVTMAQMQAAGIRSVLDLPTLDPALQIQNEAGSMETRIRGVGTVADGPGVENPVALYVDGVYYASQLMGAVNTDDVAQVSVLKGPQGTLFGRNATGGVIQITTRDPTHDRHVEATTDLDNFLTTRTNLYTTGGITDTLATNIFVAYAAQDRGWGTNFATGRDDVHKINYDMSVRNKWLFTPNDDTTIKLSFDYTNRSDNNGLNIVPFPGTEAYAQFQGFKRSSNPWDTDIYTTATDKLKHGGGSLTVDESLSFARLENTVSYRTFTFSPHFSSTASPNPGEDLWVNQAGRQATEELQLVSLDSAKIKWAAGVYYFYDSEGTGRGLFIDLLPPSFGAPVTIPIVFNTNTITNSVAGYGQATIPLGWDTNLTAGARLTYERRSDEGTETVAGGPVPLPQNAEITATRPTWRVALDHKFTPDIMGYASFNTGFKSGGFNNFDPSVAPYRPETVSTYEVGFKSEFFNHSLRVNADAFYNDYSNIQVFRYTTTAVAYNGAKAGIEGLEFSAEALLGAFRLNAGVEAMHSYFSEFPNASCSTPNVPPAAPGLTQVFCNATGNLLPYAPKVAVTTGADFEQTLPVGSIDVNLTNYYNSGYYVEPDNRLRQTAYDYVNASITWRSSDDRYFARLYGTNLLNKAVYAFAGTNQTQYTADYGNPPRLVGIKLGVKF